jgi:hypothetical protein
LCIQVIHPKDAMTFSLILNIVFAALVLTVIPGMLAWAIRASRQDGTPPTRAVRRPTRQPSFPAPRLSGAYRRREPA